MARMDRFDRRRPRVRTAAPRRRSRLPGFVPIALACVATFMLFSTPSVVPGLDRLPFGGTAVSTLPPSGPVTGAVQRRFTICGSGMRVDCVVDGDTIWLGREKVRIADINTPELSEPGCAAERELAVRARDRLQGLLNAGPLEVRSADRDEDRYGRKLRTLHRDGRSIGDTLVAEGLAHRWQGRREGWCA